MVQLPLRLSIDKYKVLSTISPRKGICGGLHFYQNRAPSFAACTAKGIMALLDHYGVPITGKKVAVIGRSCVVGLPTQLFLRDRGATVTNCDINTTGLHKIIQSSNIVIASEGSPELVKASWIKPGAVVVDVGFHVVDRLCDKTGKSVQCIVGVVHADAHQVASLITPVPFGVGPMTVAMLVENTVEAFRWHHEQKE